MIGGMAGMMQRDLKRWHREGCLATVPLATGELRTRILSFPKKYWQPSVSDAVCAGQAHHVTSLPGNHFFFVREPTFSLGQMPGIGWSVIYTARSLRGRGRNEAFHTDGGREHEATFVLADNDRDPAPSVRPARDRYLARLF